MRNIFRGALVGLICGSFTLSSCTHLSGLRGPAAQGDAVQLNRKIGAEDSAAMIETMDDAEVQKSSAKKSRNLKNNLRMKFDDKGLERSNAFLNFGENRSQADIGIVPVGFESKTGAKLSDRVSKAKKAAYDGWEKVSRQQITLPNEVKVEDAYLKQPVVQTETLTDAKGQLVKVNHTSRLIENQMASKRTSLAYGSNRAVMNLKGPSATSKVGETPKSLRRFNKIGSQDSKVQPDRQELLPARWKLDTGRVVRFNNTADYQPFADQTDKEYVDKRVKPNSRGLSVEKAERANLKKEYGGDSVLGGDDNYEPNDYQSSAYSISNYENRWLSSINGSGYQWDDDWFSFYLYAGETVTLDLRFIHAYGDIDLKLINSSGSTLASSTSTNDDEYISYTVSTAGTYYAKIYYDDEGNSYDLKWTASGGSLSDDYYEPNDSTSSAYSLVSYEDRWLSSIHGEGVAADADYYRINVSGSRRRVVVDLRYDYYSGGGDIDLALFDSSGRLLCSSTSSNDDEYLDCDASDGVSEGTHYIKVYNFSSCSLSAGSGQCNTYDMKYYTQSTGIAEDSYEQNDSQFSAAYIGGSAYNLAQYDEDWFYITVSPTQRNLVIDADFVHNEGDIDLQLRSESGAELQSSFSTDNDERIELTVPAALWNGLPPTSTIRVYLRVFGDNAGNRYSLNISSSSSFPPEDRYEENDSLAFMNNNSILTNREDTWLSNILGRGIQKDDDYYYIGPVQNLGRISVDVRFVHNLGDIDVQLIAVDPTGQIPTYVVANSIGISDDEYIDTAVRPGLNYVIRVYGDDIKGNSYDMKWKGFYDVTRLRSAFDSAYYEPATSGQGLIVNYYDLRNSQAGEQIFIGWYTYHPGFTNAPYWLTAQGAVRGNRASLSVYATEGGVFDDCLNRFRQSNGTCRTNVRYLGAATFTVTGCNTATFSFDITFPGPTAAGNIRKTGTQNLVNFGNDVIAGRNTCTGAVVAGASATLPPTQVLSLAHQGAWYEPRTSGQGMLLDMVQTRPDSTAGDVGFEGWYTYTPGPVNSQYGNSKTWMTIQSAPGQTAQGDIRMSNTPNSQFNSPPALLPEDFITMGSMELQPINCNAIRAHVVAPGVNFNPAEPSPFDVTLTRLTPVPYFEYMDGATYRKVPYCQ